MPTPTVSQEQPISLSVVVMAYNEEANISPLLMSLTAYLESRREKLTSWEIVVVDDGSSDRTALVAQEAAEDDPRIRVLQHECNRGMGAAIRTGYQAARCDYVTQLPADLQVPPETLDIFLPHVPRHDMVLSVYEDRGDGIARKLLSRGYKIVARILLGQRSDYTGTMLFRRQLVDRCPISCDTFVANLEFPIRALRSGATSHIVSFAPSPRRSGRSKVTHLRRIATVVAELLKLRRRLSG